MERKRLNGMCFLSFLISILKKIKSKNRLENFISPEEEILLTLARMELGFSFSVLSVSLW